MGLLFADVSYPFQLCITIDRVPDWHWINTVPCGLLILALVIMFVNWYLPLCEPIDPIFYGEMARLQLWTATKLGSIWRWLSTGLRSILIWFTITVFLLVSWNLFVQSDVKSSENTEKTAGSVTVNNADKSISLDQVKHSFISVLPESILFYIFIVSCWSLWKQRKRIVIDKFANYTSEPSGTAVEGLSTLLMSELSRLCTVYSSVDERRAIPTVVDVDSTIDAAIKTGDAEEGLKEPISAETTLPIAAVTLPIGSIMGLIRRITKGPIISGSLHGSEGSFYMTAQIQGGSAHIWPNGWRVSDEQLVETAEKGQKAHLKLMIDEMAAKMFADIALGGSVQWKAVSAFQNGLYSYRQCLHSPLDRSLNLHEAEKMFSKAVVEDDRFDLACYNLGVVYTELANENAYSCESYCIEVRNGIVDEGLRDYRKAAKRAFLKAIERNPKRWENYYALALNFYSYDDVPNIEMAVQLCDHMLQFKPNNAQAYDLKGLALGKLRNRTQEALENHRNAACIAWKALCREELKGHDTGNPKSWQTHRTRTIAVQCLRNLATHCFREALRDKDEQQLVTFDKASKLLKLAVSLSTMHSELYYELGKIHICWDKPEDAVRYLEKAIQIDPERPEYWAFKAVVYSRKQQARLELRKNLLEYAVHHLDSAKKIGPGESGYWSIKSVVYSKDDEHERNQAWVEFRKNSLGLSERKLYELCKDLKEIGAAEHHCMRRMINLLRTLTKISRETSIKYKVSRLKRRERRYRKNDQIWELARVSHELAHVYLCLRYKSTPRHAIKLLESTIRKLDSKYGKGIVWQEPRALLGKALIEQRKYREALMTIRLALKYNPLNASLKQVLAQAYEGIGDYNMARDVWEEALLVDPNNPYIYYKAGRSSLKSVEYSHDKELVGKTRSRAVDYLNHALELFPSTGDGMVRRRQVYYWLGLAYTGLHRYDDAIAHLRITSECGPEVVLPRIHLAAVYIRAGMYAEGERECEDAIGKFKKLMKEKNYSPNDFFGDELDDCMAIAVIMSKAYLWQALSWMEREINFSKAKTMLKESYTWISQLKEDSIEKRRRLSDYYECYGEILLKQNNIDGAINSLKQATSFANDAEIYISLIEAYWRKQMGCSNRSKVRLLLTEAQSYCAKAKQIDIDISDKYKDAIEHYMADIEEKIKQLDTAGAHQ